jgi:preprotein translocase subunit SecG
MYTAITIVIVIVCVLLSLVVMVQNAKGGGLASGFVSSTQIMGVQKTTDLIEKLTWGLALGLVALCLIAGLSLPGKESRNYSSSVQEQVENAGAPQNIPPAPPPGQNQSPQGQPQQNP